MEDKDPTTFEQMVLQEFERRGIECVSQSTYVTKRWNRIWP